MFRAKIRKLSQFHLKIFVLAAVNYCNLYYICTYACLRNVEMRLKCFENVLEFILTSDHQTRFSFIHIEPETGMSLRLRLAWYCTI